MTRLGSGEWRAARVETPCERPRRADLRGVRGGGYEGAEAVAEGAASHPVVSLAWWSV